MTLHRRLRRLIVLASAVALLATVVSLPVAAKGPPPGKGPTVDIQILAINDFHGNLEPIPSSSSSGRIGAVPAGGVEYLATHLKERAATNPNTVIVSAGDLIGASPLTSALFHDEPTIEAANAFGLDYNAVGNHEFDEGTAELLRMQEGGCHPVDGCQDGDPFRGADFQFLAANVVSEATGRTLFPGYKVHNFKGARVAFIGMTLEGTPTIVTPSGVAGYDFQDEADTVNALVPKLKRKGIETIVVLIHEGGLPTGAFNECPGISGPIVDIVNRTDDEVDLFISGHTHQAYNCVIDGRPVTSAASFGRLITDIDINVDRRTGDAAVIKVDNLIVTRDVDLDTTQSAIIAKYRDLSAPLANRPIGQITADILRAQNPAGESPLGDVIADAQLDATDDPGFGDAVMAFMNPGGIRTDLIYAGSPAGEGDGVVTYGESFAVQPFGNSMVTMTVTGAQIETMLEQQFCQTGSVPTKILQVSTGFTYTWSDSGACGSKVDPASIMLSGSPILAGSNYRVTVNSFLADGGDQFLVLAQGTDRLGGDVDTDALEKYLTKNAPVAPPPLDRITQVP
jgi:5'-nucleotidase